MMKTRKKSGLRREQRMYQGKAVAQKEAITMDEAGETRPAFLCEERPEENRAATKDDCRWAFGEHSESQKKSEEQKCGPGGMRENRRVFISR